MARIWSCVGVVCLFSALLVSSVAGASLAARTVPEGRVVTLKLPSAPFPHPARARGYTYQGTHYPADPCYSDSSVAVFIPSGFRAAGPVNLVFFFHGWNSSVEEASRGFELYRQFSQSGVNALLVVPELAREAPDSFAGKLEEAGGFARLVGDLLQGLRSRGVIGQPGPGSIVLAGHSGAYRVIAQILRQGGLAGHIREVYLFDALLDWEDVFARWIEGGGGRFVSVDAFASETSSYVQSLLGLLRGAHVRVTVAPDEFSADRRGLRSRSRVVFLQSPFDHYGVVAGRDELRRILSTSASLGS
jgi:hypothetical protein